VPRLHSSGHRAGPSGASGGDARGVQGNPRPRPATGQIRTGRKRQQDTPICCRSASWGISGCGPGPSIAFVFVLRRGGFFGASVTTRPPGRTRGTRSSRDTLSRRSRGRRTARARAHSPRSLSTPPVAIRQGSKPGGDAKRGKSRLPAQGCCGTIDAVSGISNRITGLPPACPVPFGRPGELPGVFLSPLERPLATRTECGFRAAPHGMTRRGVLSCEVFAAVFLVSAPEPESAFSGVLPMCAARGGETGADPARKS
jgi:hypothetical protein